MKTPLPLEESSKTSKSSRRLTSTEKLPMPTSLTFWISPAESQFAQNFKEGVSNVAAARCGFPRLHIDHESRQCGEWLDNAAKVATTCYAGGMVALLGERGRGKTQMAVDIALAKFYGEWVHRTDITEPLFTSARAILRKIRETQNSQDEALLWRRLKQCQTLIIDDIHELKGTDFDNRVLFEIIDFRYSMMQPLILIANQTIAEFTRLVGDSAVSRINERGTIINCTWPSFRK